jgi:hypothetical protein
LLRASPELRRNQQQHHAGTAPQAGQYLPERAECPIGLNANAEADQPRRVLGRLSEKPGDDSRRSDSAAMVSGTDPHPLDLVFDVLLNGHRHKHRPRTTTIRTSTTRPSMQRSTS